MIPYGLLRMDKDAVFELLFVEKPKQQKGEEKIDDGWHKKE